MECKLCKRHSTRSRSIHKYLKAGKIINICTACSSTESKLFDLTRAADHDYGGGYGCTGEDVADHHDAFYAGANAILRAL